MNKNVDQKSENGKFAFSAVNYKFLGVGLALLVIGYILMSGGGSDDPNVFSYEIFSFRRITLAPYVILSGYGFILFAILKKS
tara:strand:+ start:828 stop:1073 length:246 start_codon:yes stop_codon:yes gene_type:complete